MKLGHQVRLTYLPVCTLHLDNAVLYPLLHEPDLHVPQLADLSTTPALDEVRLGNLMSHKGIREVVREGKRGHTV